MVRIPLQIVAILALIGVAWWGAIHHASKHMSKAASLAEARTNAQPGEPNPAAPQMSHVAVDFRALQAARTKVLQEHPDLAAEYKDLISQVQAQQQALNDAMIKADPKVAPILAKLAALRQRPMVAPVPH